jgi:hypothetical protein
MRHIVLISCGKEKRSQRTKVRDMYIGDLFQKSIAYARSLSPDSIYILSAKHGLLSLDVEIEPYEETLKGKSKPHKMMWSERVVNELRRVSRLDADRFTILAGRDYREFLLPHIHHYQIPMEGKRQGEQLQYLKEQLA